MSDNGAMKLMEALSGVDEELLERCESAVIDEIADVQNGEIKAEGQGNVISFGSKLKKHLSKSIWQYGSAVAAVLCVAIVGLASLAGLRVGSTNDVAYEAVTEGANGNVGALADSEVAGGTAPESSLVATMQYAGMDVTEAERRQESADGVADIGADSAAEESDTNSHSEQKSAATESVEAENGTASKDTIKQESAGIEDSGTGGCKLYVYEEVIESEARGHETFGVYIPTAIPDGYVLEGAYVSGEGEAVGIMVSWSRGMDSIMVNITLPEEAPATVDVTKTETYDEYLYEIPLAETVPEDYREVFNNPVCAWEDFSLEFVQKRMIYRGDAGDTTTPRGNFSVLYPDGVLVYFNGRGTAEEIWRMFVSIKADT